MSKYDSFFSKLREFILYEIKYNKRNNLIGYYETMKQGMDKISDVVLDLENNIVDYQFHYHDDETGGYTDGKIAIYPNEWQKYNYIYEIEFRHNERYWGYCECSPNDEGYNEKHRCCGMGCDYTFPEIQINKIETLSHFSFSGYAKDLWELEDKWNAYTRQHEIEVLENMLLDNERYINGLLSEKEKMENKLRELMNNE